MLIFGEAHLRRILSAYAAYYNQARTHLALQKDALCVPKTSSNTLELAGPRWLAWRRLVCSSSPSATIPSRTALSRDFVARKREEFAAF
jgi:hypothetical protein